MTSRNMLRVLLISALLIGDAGLSRAEAISGNAQIRKYCADLSMSTGGSYTIEEECRRQETAAAKALIKLDPEQRIWDYCQEISDSAGGSYMIFLECVKQEMQAKSRLR